MFLHFGTNSGYLGRSYAHAKCTRAKKRHHLDADVSQTTLEYAARRAIQGEWKQLNSEGLPKNPLTIIMV